MPIFLFSTTWRLLSSRQDVSPPMSPQSRWDACVRAGRGPGAWARGPDPVPPAPEAQGPGPGGHVPGPGGRQWPGGSRLNVILTVAILAQGTHWAVAVTQAFFFAQVRFPLPSLFFNSRASCAQLLLGFLPSSTFGGCHRGCPIRPSLQHSMPSTECHCLLDFLVANRACPYHGVICWCLQCSKDNFFSTIQF